MPGVHWCFAAATPFHLRVIQLERRNTHPRQTGRLTLTLTLTLTPTPAFPQASQPAHTHTHIDNQTSTTRPWYLTFFSTSISPNPQKTKTRHRHRNWHPAYFPALSQIPSALAQRLHSCNENNGRPSQGKARQRQGKGIDGLCGRIVTLLQRSTNVTDLGSRPADPTLLAPLSLQETSLLRITSGQTHPTVPHSLVTGPLVLYDPRHLHAFVEHHCTTRSALPNTRPRSCSPSRSHEPTKPRTHEPTNPRTHTTDQPSIVALPSTRPYPCRALLCFGIMTLCATLLRPVQLF